MANYNDYLEYLKHIDNTTEQEITNKVNTLSDEISNLKTSLTNLNKVKDDLTTDLGNARKQVTEKTDLINIKETELKKVSNDLSNVQKELKETSLKFSELEKLHSNEQKKNAILSNEITELKSKYSVLENEVKTKNKSVNDYVAEIQKLHLDIESSKKDYVEYKEQADKFKTEIDEIKSATTNVSSNFEITKLRSDNTNLSKQIEILKSTVEEYSQIISDRNKKIDSFSELTSDSANQNNIIDTTKSQTEKNKSQKKLADPSLILSIVGIIGIVALVLFVTLSEKKIDNDDVTEAATESEIVSEAVDTTITNEIYKKYIEKLGDIEDFNNDKIRLYSNYDANIDALVKEDKDLLSMLKNTNKEAKLFIFTNDTITIPVESNIENIELGKYPNTVKFKNSVYIGFRDKN